MKKIITLKLRIYPSMTKFYNSISHLKYTTAMLQELLFFNRKSENILEHTDDFKKIVEKNDNKKIVEDGDITTKMFM